MFKYWLTAFDLYRWFEIWREHIDYILKLEARGEVAIMIHDGYKQLLKEKELEVSLLKAEIQKLKGLKHEDLN